MTREDLTMTTVMTVMPALFVVSVVLAAIAIGRMPRQGRQAAYAITGATLATLMVASVVGTFWFWGVGFEYADSLRQPPAHVDRAILVGASVAAGTYAGLLVTGLLAHRSFRRLTPIV